MMTLMKHISKFNFSSLMPQIKRLIKRGVLFVYLFWVG